VSLGVTCAHEAIFRTAPGKFRSSIRSIPHWSRSWRPLRNAALVSSTRRFRSWSRAGRAFHHIMDPRTGDSSRTTVVAVVAEASEAWWAEGVAKSIVIAGVDDGTALARACGVRAWMFLDDGQMIDVVP